MHHKSRTTTAALILATAGAAAFAAGATKAPAAVEEPDIVIGGSSKAMSMPVQRTPSVAPAITTPGQLWTVETKDVNLANTFQRWAASAGWKVRWDAQKHVMLEAPDTFSGTFEEAVAAQLSSPGIAMSSYPLEVCFYPNNPPLARITRKGDQAKECQ